MMSEQLLKRMARVEGHLRTLSQFYAIGALAYGLLLLIIPPRSTPTLRLLDSSFYWPELAGALYTTFGLAALLGCWPKLRPVNSAVRSLPWYGLAVNFTFLGIALIYTWIDWQTEQIGPAPAGTAIVAYWVLGVIGWILAEWKREEL